jgi:hypothetical protein
MAQNNNIRLIGKSKLEICQFMTTNKAYFLAHDTVLIDKGEVISFQLKTDNDSTIIANNAVVITYVFTSGRCDGISMICYGSESLNELSKRFDKEFRRLGTNVWIDDTVSVGLRILVLPSYTSRQGIEIAMFRVDIGRINIFKN